MRARGFFLVLAGLLAWLAPTPTLAQDIDCASVSLEEQTTPDQAQVAFDMLRFGSCLGDKRCRIDLLQTEVTVDGKDLCAAVSAWEEKGPTQPKVVASAAHLIRALLASLESVETLPGITEPQRRMLAEMSVKSTALWAAQSVDHLPTSDWDMDPVMFDSGPERRVDFLETLRAECATPETCPTALRDIAAIFSHGQLFERILSGLLEDRRRAAIEQLELVDAMWASVRTSARGLYPWEVWLNGFLIDIDEIDIFAPPPNYQYILLHPAAGYEYSAEHGGSEPLFEAAVLEIAGYYRWSFTAEGDLRHAWGGSLITTWRNHPAGQNLGFGVMVHLPRNWSAGVTYRDRNEYSLLLGVDAAKWLTRPGRWQETLQSKLAP